MPGHGGSSLGGEKLFSASAFDWTEVEGLDNLLESDDVILESEKLLAKSYGYEYALMLTEGATVAMQIALNVAKNRSLNVAALGDMHKSFWNACSLAGIKAYHADRASEIYDIGEKADIGAVFVTSPDYFGNVMNLEEIKRAAEDIGALLIVDEAHSAHYVFSSLLPDNAHAFADMSLVGMHKTLPVYGGGGALFVNGRDLYEEARSMRAALHSTSPSYLVMASIDYARDHMEREGERAYKELKNKVDEFAKNLKKGKVVETADFSRLVIKFEGKDCYDLMRQLAKRGIFIEAAYGDRLVLIVTPFNLDKLDLLIKELDDIPLKDGEEYELPVLKNAEIKGFSQSELIDIDDCEGRISASEIGIYPPGVPAIHKGDVMDKNAVVFLKKYKNRLFGLASGRVAVIK